MAELNGAPVSPAALAALALVNYGHFTSMRVESGQVRGLSHHLERLVRDCHTLFGTELDREQIRAYLAHAVGDESGVFIARVTVFDPALELARPATAGSPSVLVTTRPVSRGPMAPLRVQSADYVRDLPQIKHIGLCGSLWHRRRAQLSGFDDAVFADARGCLSEGPTWNLGFSDGDHVIWPNAEVLPGITMRLLQQVHEKSVLRSVNLQDLPGMEAAFATNVTFGVRPIGRINDQTLPVDHAIFDDLRKEYEDIPAESL